MAESGPCGGGRTDHGQYVTFVCAGTEYGVPIMAVQEIKGWEPVTTIPCAPYFLLGVMNLRGAVVPVIDLRRVLGLSAHPFDVTTAVVLVHAEVSGGPMIAGLVVDAVSEVYDIGAEAIQDVPDVGAVSEEIAISGVAAIDGKTVLLLDVNPLVGALARASGAGGQAIDSNKYVEPPRRVANAAMS